MPKPDALRFNSKIDLWILVLLLLAVAACLWGVARIAETVSASPEAMSIWLALGLGIPLVVGIGLPLWLLVATRYYLSDTELEVQSGPLRWTIPIRDIRAVSSTHSMLASPALSLDRVLIEYGQGQGQAVMISPEPRDAFLRQLEHRRGLAGGS